MTNKILERVARLIGKRAHEVGHAAVEFGHITVHDIERAAARRKPREKADKAHPANVNDKSVN